MLGRQSRIVVVIALLIVVCGVGTQWAIQALSVPLPPKPAFQRHQWVEMQIVTAPTQPSANGYVYEEAETVVHATRRILIDASGSGRTFYSVSHDVPIEISYSSAEPIKDGNGIVLKDLSLFFPVRFRVNEHLNYSWQNFMAHDTEVPSDYHSFKRGISIYYQEHPLSNTFVRMRHAGEMKELPVIDLAPAIGQ